MAYVNVTYLVFNSFYREFLFIFIVLALADSARYIVWGSFFVMSITFAIASFFHVFVIRRWDNLQYTIWMERLYESRLWRAGFILFNVGILAFYLVYFKGTYSIATAVSVGVQCFALLLQVSKYDSAYHSLLRIENAPKLPIRFGKGFYTTSMIMQTLFEISLIVNDGDTVHKYVEDPRFTHIQWEIAKDLTADDIKTLKAYIFGIKESESAPLVHSSSSDSVNRPFDQQAKYIDRSPASERKGNV